MLGFSLYLVGHFPYNIKVLGVTIVVICDLTVSWCAHRLIML